MAVGNEGIERAAEALRRGDAVIFPTETVYGLGVSVAHAESPRLLYQLKRRPANKPIAWLVGSAQDLDRYGRDVPEEARLAAQRHWPGPLTIIVKAGDAVSSSFASEQGTIGLRMPQNPTALKLLDALGCPIATTSANESGQQAPSAQGRIDEALAASVGFVLTDEAEKSGVASTIIDCSGPEAKVVRQGAIDVQDLLG